MPRRGGRLRELRAVADDFVAKNLMNTGAALGAALLLLGTGPVAALVGAAAALASLAAVCWRRRRELLGPRQSTLLGYFVTVRVLLLLAVAGGFVQRRPDERGFVLAAAVLLVLAVMAEPLLRGLLTRPRQVAVNLPGLRPPPEPPLAAGWLASLGFAAIAVGGVLAALAAPGWTWLLVAAGVVVPLLLLTRHAVLAEVVNRRTQRNLTKALTAYEPAFAVYYAAVSGVTYQLGMWLPYLERLGRPYVVITRNPVTIPAITALTSAPVLSPKTGATSASLDAMVVPSLRAAFYVQGSPGNATFQRYRQLTHVWLNHGDSDKQANYHPRHATYDKLFVSGQQGIDRYAAHGIEVPPEKFCVVGRPQLERIEVRRTPPAPGSPRTVLYAPTWKGGRPSSNYSSLPLAERVVGALLARGATVVFRPHPLSYTDTVDRGRVEAVQRLLADDARASGREHVWGPQAERDWDVPDCFNHSDALVTDVSSVASDFLASGKPFAMCAILSGGTEFLAEFPTARVAYVIERDLSTLDAALDALLGDADPLAAAREEYRRYCVGDDLGADAPREFLRVAGAIVDGRG